MTSIDRANNDGGVKKNKARSIEKMYFLSEY